MNVAKGVMVSRGWRAADLGLACGGFRRVSASRWINGRCKPGSTAGVCLSWLSVPLSQGSAVVFVSRCGGAQMEVSVASSVAGRYAAVLRAAGLSARVRGEGG